MEARWPSVAKVHSNFENAYSNPSLINQIMPELHSLVEDHVDLCKRLEHLHGHMNMERVTETLQLIHSELQTHFVAEEQVLFPLLANYLGGLEAGPIGIMMEEHRMIRSLYGDTMDLFESTRQEAERLAKKLADLSKALLDHLGKEDTGIFLMASETLSGEEKRKVAKELPQYQEKS